MLELLLTLALLGGIVTVMGWRLQAPTRAASDDTKTLETFVRSARLVAMRSGQADVLVFDAGMVTARSGSLSWDRATTEVKLDTADAIRGRIVLYPDGSVAGPALQISITGDKAAADFIW
jgi:hypothetical protein